MRRAPSGITDDHDDFILIRPAGHDMPLSAIIGYAFGSRRHLRSDLMPLLVPVVIRVDKFSPRTRLQTFNDDL